VWAFLRAHSGILSDVARLTGGRLLHLLFKVMDTHLPNGGGFRKLPILR